MLYIYIYIYNGKTPLGPFAPIALSSLKNSWHKFAILIIFLIKVLHLPKAWKSILPSGFSVSEKNPRYKCFKSAQNELSFI